MELKEPDRKTKKNVLGRKIFAQQNDILNKYFVLDDKTGTATIEFHYTHLEDMLDQTIGNGKARFFSSEFKDKLSGIVAMIPNVYKIKLAFVIKDYDGYTIEEANHIFADNLDIQFFNSRVILRRKRNVSFILLLFGLFFLIANILLSFYFKNLNMNEMTQSIISEVLDIAAWVFIWEAVTIYFIDRSEVKVKTEAFRLRIKEITFESPEEYHPVSIASSNEPEEKDKEPKYSENK
jgi:hypothetical protein